jgi:hypothetical protein
MEAATMKPDGERTRSAVTALQHAQKRLVPMDDDPIQELWNIRQLLRDRINSGCWHLTFPKAVTF